MLSFVEVRYPLRNYSHMYNFIWFLGLSAKLWKATISFVMSIHPDGTNRLQLDGFLWHFMYEYFSKVCREN